MRRCRPRPHRTGGSRPDDREGAETAPPEQATAGRRWSGDIEHLAEVDSTNRHLVALALGGAPEGRAVYADHQRAGRGRLDRRWIDDPGTSLLASLLLRPDRSALAREQWPLLSLLTALAGRAASGRCADVWPQCKWPNDLVVGERKLAGVLAEVVRGHEPAVVVGIGLNVSASPDALEPRGARLEPAALADFTESPPSRAGLMVRLLDEVQLRYRFLLELGPAPLLEEYRRCCSTLGRPVGVELPDGSRLAGTAVDVDERGALELELDGRRVQVLAGDVVHLRATR
jgi:BirA family biotin operon repressor/biotin-[acetyl-CoA-carboxylase] ligase